MNACKSDESDQFELHEAVQLINTTVMAKERLRLGDQTVSSIGIVVGVLSLNEEVEVVIKFMDRVTQMTKREFVSEIEALADDDGL